MIAADKACRVAAARLALSSCTVTLSLLINIIGARTSSSVRKSTLVVQFGRGAGPIGQSIN